MAERNRVIFLDFDGVLNNPGCYAKASGSRTSADPRCVAALNHITDHTGAFLVISSTFRLAGLMFCKDKLREWGVTGQVLGSTCRQQLEKRGYEIGEWLQFAAEFYDDPIESFVILDDDSDMAGHASRLVQTNGSVGLTMADAERAVRMLESKPSEESNA